ncbi:MFS general substrate transporter [Aureobasidium sp. EXF-10727]|nr:MFS general substrate transporter [Aureobasidium sp. EXF-10727]
MERDESDKAVKDDEERVPFDVVPNPDTRVDQGADEKAVRHSRDSDTDEQPRPRSKDEESGITAMGDGGANEKEFEVTWDGDDDPINPRSMAYARKWIIVIIVSASSLCVTCTSALYTSTYAQLEPEFHCSRIVATLGLSLFVVGLGLGPMVMSPLSECSRRNGWRLVSQSPTLTTNGILYSGSVCWTWVHSICMARVYAYSRLAEIGPIVGGFINYYANWRWTFYVLLIWSGGMLAAIIFLVPETYHPVLLRRKAIKLRKDTGNPAWRAPIENMNKSVFRTVAWSCVRPFQLLFLEAMCLSLCILSAILLGILYLFFGAFPLVFENNHGFVLWQTGLTFIGIFVGMVTGVSCDPIWKKNYSRLVTKNGGVSEPEFRLPPTILGAILVPIGLFGFGWTTYSSVHWIVPIVFSGIFGLGNIFVFSGVFTFLVECYPLYAASALAANSFARSSFAAAFPLFGVQMYDKLGYQWVGNRRSNTMMMVK